MKQGDHVKIIGKDGFYVYVREVAGMATVRAGGKNNLDKPCLDIPLSQVISLEKAE
jgi:hypothetical protein